MKNKLFLMGILFSFLLITGCNVMVDDNKINSDNNINNTVIENQDINEQILKGPVTNKLVFIPISEGKVVDSLMNNSIDMYLGALSQKEAEKLNENNDFELIFAPSQQFDVSFNLAPSTDEILNPFSIKRIRNVMNNLVNREEMIDDVFNGYAIKKPTFIFEASPDYNVISDVVNRYDLSYNPEYAKNVILEEMTKHGAYLVNNTWHYNEKPVIVKYAIYAGGDYGEIIEVSDYVSKAIEDAGFMVEKIFYDMDTRDEDLVLRSDPAKLEWNIRTGTGIYFGFSQFYVYELINLAPVYNKGSPGSRTEHFWIYNHSRLDIIATKLQEGNYSNKEEWEELFRQGMDIVLNESYTISLVAKQTIFAINSQVKDFFISNFTGIRLLQNYREVNIPQKDTITIGTKETYNAGEGFNPNWFGGNIYRMDIKMALRDFGVWSNPKTLEYEPLRWDYDIITAGPFGKLDVPTDAINWNSTEHKWKYVENNTKATTLVRFDMSKYINSSWHHNVTISWADILYTLAQDSERVYNEKWNKITEDSPSDIEPYIAYMINNNSLDVYVNKWHFNDGEIAYFTQFSVEPWLLFLATNSIVYDDNTLMYSNSKKDEFNVSVMRLINNEHIKIVLDKINSITFEDIESYFTIGEHSYITQDEFNSRKQALNEWAQQKDNLIIGEGGYYFNSFDEKTGKVILEAFRDSSYPFKKGDLLIEN
jgi:peptide/nickel transport system substrate-binding protein